MDFIILEEILKMYVNNLKITFFAKFLNRGIWRLEWNINILLFLEEFLSVVDKLFNLFSQIFVFPIFINIKYIKYYRSYIRNIEVYSFLR